MLQGVLSQAQAQAQPQTNFGGMLVGLVILKMQMRENVSALNVGREEGMTMRY